MSYRDAVLFQRITVALAFLPLAVLELWQYLAILPSQRDGSRLGWLLEYVGVGVIAGCLWLFLTAATTAAGYFFHPQWLPIVRQNRAVAISYYACAPLSFAPIAAAIIGMLKLIERSYWAPPNIRARSETLIELLAELLIAAIIIGWWGRTLTLLRRTTRCGMDRLFALAAYLPIVWIILGTIFLGILPLAYLIIAVMILSAAGH